MARNILDSMHEAAKEVDRWPDWMKLSMGIPIKKKTRKEKQDQALEIFLEAWAKCMESYQVGKYHDELDRELAKMRVEIKKRKVKKKNANKRFRK